MGETNRGGLAISSIKIAKQRKPMQQKRCDGYIYIVSGPLAVICAGNWGKRDRLLATNKTIEYIPIHCGQEIGASGTGFLLQSW
jgi:hypothetical protein